MSARFFCCSESGHAACVACDWEVTVAEDANAREGVAVVERGWKRLVITFAVRLVGRMGDERGRGEGVWDR